MSVDNHSISDLLASLCDETISSEEMQRLDGLICTDAAARRLYFEYLDLHARLSFQASTPNGAGAEDAIEAVGSPPWAASDDRQIGGTLPWAIGREAGGGNGLTDESMHHVPPAPPVIIQSLPISSSLLSSFVGSPLFSYLVAAVLMGVGLLVAAAWRLSDPLQVVEHADPLTPYSATQSPRASVVARITGMVDCQWEGTGMPNQKLEVGNQKSHLHLGDCLSLRSGLLEITYDTGARVILQGPVTYEAESPSGGYLSMGKLTAKLEKRSEVSGQRSESDDQKLEIRNQKSPDLFAIRTPTALVTDLGTEFGVEVGRAGVTETHVFVGEVRVAVADGAGNCSGQTRVIRAGQSACIGQHERLSVRTPPSRGLAGRFTRVMPTPQQVSTPNAYANLVLSMKPALYYRMEPPTDEKDRNVLFDSAPGGHHGVLRYSEGFAGQPYDRGRFGQSLHLRGQMVSDCAVVPDYPKTDSGQLSVSAWVEARAFTPYATLAQNFSPLDVQPPNRTGQFFLGFAGECDLFVIVMQEDGKEIHVREGSESAEAASFPRGTWQHVAFVADGAMLRLYRNGVEVAEGPCRGVARQPSPRNLGIGCQTNSDAVGLAPKPFSVWSGRLDEIAVFNHAIRAEQVRQLYTGTNRAAKPCATASAEARKRGEGDSPMENGGAPGKD